MSDTIAQRISSGVAVIYKDRYGRGPTKVVTYVNPDCVFCVLESVNLPAQDALVEFGASEVAQAIHHRLQLGMRPQLTAVVEAETGRRVRAYVPGFDATIDATTDAFLLART